MTVDSFGVNIQYRKMIFCCCRSSYLVTSGIFHAGGTFRIFPFNSIHLVFPHKGRFHVFLHIVRGFVRKNVAHI